MLHWERGGDAGLGPIGEGAEMEGLGLFDKGGLSTSSVFAMLSKSGASSGAEMGALGLFDK